jgi:hypothetical protein
MKQWNYPVLIIALIAPLLVAAAPGDFRRAPQLAYTLDLKMFGALPEHGRHPDSVRSPRLLVFGRDGRLGFGLENRERATTLVTREDPASSLQIVVLNGSDGKKIAETSVPIALRDTVGMYVGRSGNFVVRSNGQLRLFGPDLVLITSNQVATSHRISWNLFNSQDGSSLLISAENGEGDQNLTLLDGDNLRPLYSCSLKTGLQAPTTILGYSGASLLPDSNSVLRVRRLALQEICKSQRIIYEWNGDAAYPTLLNKDRLVLTGPTREILLLSTEGQVVSRELLARSTTSDQHVASNLNGKMFAIAAKTFRGGSSLFDISAHLTQLKIIVFDSQNGKKLCEIPILPAAINSFDFALSSDGTLLAVRTDEILQVFRLPDFTSKN